MSSSVVSPEVEGLRARKARIRRHAIHRAAVTLAVERGVDATTVADIAEAANVSTRTFFNYFPTKEDALVGLYEGVPTDDELDAFREGFTDDIVRDMLRLFQSVFAPGDGDLPQMRKQLVRSHPELLQRYWARLHAMEERVAEATEERMRASGRWDHVGDLDDAARMLVMTGVTITRFAVRRAVEGDASRINIERHIDASLATLREVLRTLP